VRAVASTSPDYLVAAAQTFPDWRFEPARWRGEPVGATFGVPFRFDPRGPGKNSPEWILSGQPRDASDRAQAEAGATVKQPVLERFTLPPLPWEFRNARHPREVAFRVEVDEDGDVTAVELDRADPAWEPHLRAAIRTWAFKPGQIGESKIDWLVQDRIPVDPPPRALIRTVPDPGAVPDAAAPGRPRLRMVGPPLIRFKPDTADLAVEWMAEIDLLVADDGRVVATHVHSTNDAAFALHVRTLAAYSVFEPAPASRTPTATWLRERHTQLPRAKPAGAAEP